MTALRGRADTEAAGVYAAEDAVLSSVALRRFRRFTDIEEYVASLTLSPWWDQRFGAAPLDVRLQRRSHTATMSCATVAGGHVGVIALVDGSGWGLETVLHELAHVAVGIRAGHGPVFRAALADLWRHEAGVVAWAALDAELAGSPRREGAAEQSRREGSD